MIARHHGCCPICAKYIAVGRSKIDQLPLVLPIDPALAKYRARDGQWFADNGPIRRPGGSQWAHERCVAAGWRKWKTGPEWQAECARRLEALREIRELEEAMER